MTLPSSPWYDTILKIISTVKAGVDAVKGLKQLKEVLKKDYTIAEIKKGLEQGSLEIGSQVRVIGTYSEFLPFVDIKTLLPNYYKTNVEKILTLNSICTTRLNSINNIHCGALYLPDQTRAVETKRSTVKAPIEVFVDVDEAVELPINDYYYLRGRNIEDWELQHESNPCIPIFYSKIPESTEDKSRKMKNYSTGFMVEVDCEIRELPDEWRNIITPSEGFVFKDIENKPTPFGLKIIDVAPYGMVPEFFIDAWCVCNFDYEHRKHVFLKDWLDVFEIACKSGYSLRARQGLTYKRKYPQLFIGHVFKSACQFAITDVNVLDDAWVAKSMEMIQSMPLFVFGTIPDVEFSIDFQYDQILKPIGNFNPKQNSSFKYLSSSDKRRV